MGFDPEQVDVVGPVSVVAAAPALLLSQMSFSHTSGLAQ